MINLRKELDRVLENFGHEVIYVERDIRFHCACYTERSGEPKSNCPTCFGTGYKVQLKKIKIRRMVSSVPETLIGVNQTMQAGIVTPKAYVYYMEHDKKPKENDLILEVIWDINGVPRHIKEKLLISAVAPQYGHKGRVEFYQTYCRFDQKGGNDDNALSEY